MLLKGHINRSKEHVQLTTDMIRYNYRLRDTMQTLLPVHYLTRTTPIATINTIRRAIQLLILCTKTKAAEPQHVCLERQLQPQHTACVTLATTLHIY